MSIKSFIEIRGLDFIEKKLEAIKKEIDSTAKDYILGVEEYQYCDYLFDKHKIEPLKIFLESEEINEPKKITDVQEFYNREIRREGYQFTVSYYFEGSQELFRVSPSTRAMVWNNINIDYGGRKVSYGFTLFSQDPEQFKREKETGYHDAFVNVENINDDVTKWNPKIQATIRSTFASKRQQLGTENDFFKQINVKVSPTSGNTFVVPSVRPKAVPQPQVPKGKSIEQDPRINDEIYADIIKALYDLGKSIEKKPSLYKDKDEESLREQFLLVLETRYEGMTATGETFNRSGKTDILLKYAADSSNVFIAECKIWKGSAEFLKAISQLFDRYLTWRDSKVALMIFVQNKDFTNVLNTIKADIKNHPYYVRENGTNGESSLSYIFHLAEDKEKHAKMEVLVFHYDK